MRFCSQKNRSSKGVILISHMIKLAFSVAGSVIGAGFATGKELQLFFQSFGVDSLIYLTLSVALMAVVSILYFTNKKTMLHSTLTHRLSNLLFLLFSGASCIVMFACGGEALSESFLFPAFFGNSLTCIITLWIVSKGITSIYRFNLIATPILFSVIVVLCLIGISVPVGSFSQAKTHSFNMLLYTGYNLLSVLPFLSAIEKDTDKKTGTKGILFGFFLILTAALFIKLLLNLHHDAVTDSSLPMMKLAGMIHPFLSYLYTVMLYLSVLTTAVNSLYAVSRGKETIKIGCILFVLSLFGFTALIETLYPIFGYLGIGIVILIIWETLFSKAK